MFLTFCAVSDSFTKHSKWLQVGPKPNAIVAVDLNDNGLPDIVTANTGTMRDPRQEQPANNELSLLMAAGDLEYVTQPPLRTGFAPYAIAIGNVDVYKAPDIVVASFLDIQHRDLCLFRNLGDIFEPAFFSVPDEPLPYNRMKDGDGKPVFTKPGLTSLILLDINRDGYRDVVATGWSSDVLVHFPGAPDTYFGQPQFTRAKGGPRDLKAADFDKDGHTDLAVALYTSNELGIWKGDGTGAFEPATHFGTRGRLPNRVQVGDLNGDGELDLIVSHCYTDDSVVVFYGRGGFDFSMSEEITLGEDREVLEHEIRDILVTDLNDDGKPDIAAACHGSRKVVVLLNESEGASLPQVFRHEVYEYEKGRPRALCVADFNADGAIDIGVALWDVNAISLLLGEPRPKEK